MIIDSSQVPVDAAPNRSTHYYEITKPPAACVNALWTQCDETAVRMAGGYPVLRCPCSAARSHQGDGNPRFRFGFCTLSMPSGTPHLYEPKEPILNSPSPSWADQSRRAVQDALVLLQSGKPPFLNVAACLVETPAFEFLQTFWLALNMPIKTDATADAAKRLAVFVLATPRASPTPPLLPIFLHNLLPSLIDKFDNPNLGQAMTGDLELLIAVISSSLMAALQLERALYTASGEQASALGSSSSAMASRLALGLRHRKSSSKGKLIAQRLTSSQTFVANFPVFKTEI
jgi:hypothetical protein